MTRLATALVRSAIALMLVGTAVLVGWRVHGGSWVRVESPSLGTTAPVGSLLWVGPVGFEDVRVGDLVTFHPPGSEQTYSHLVTAVNDDGTLSTQGRLTAPDPWRVTADQVVGRTVLVWPAVGWLVAAAPLLAGGGLLVWLLLRFVRDVTLRPPLALLGAAVVITAAVVVYRPLLGAQQLSFTPEDGAATATYVGTGLLPVRLSTPQGDSVVLRPGHVGTVTTTGSAVTPTGDAEFSVALGPAVPAVWWWCLVLTCFVPAAADTWRTARGRHVLLH